MIEGELTVVGGWVNLLDRTNKLFTLRKGKWFEIYPPMKTACTQPAAVSTPDVVVIGGHCGNDVGWTNTVELFQVKERKWSGVINLPPALLPQFVALNFTSSVIMPMATRAPSKTCQALSGHLSLVYR